MQGDGGPGTRKEQLPVPTGGATFAPVTESSRRDGAGGGVASGDSWLPAEALAGAPGNPWLPCGRRPQGPRPPQAPRFPVSTRHLDHASGPKKYLHFD